MWWAAFQSENCGMARHTGIVFAALLAATVGGSIPGQAADNENKLPWDGEPLAADPRSFLREIAALPPPQNANLDLILYEQQLRFDDAGRRTIRHRQIYRAMSRGLAESMGNTEWSWAPWYQERPEVQARVITADGQAHVLDPKTAVELPFDTGDGRVFSNRRILRAPLPGMEANAVVEEVWQEHDNKPPFEAGSLTIAPTRGATTIRHWRLIVEHPVGLTVRVKTIAENLEPTRRLDGSMVRLVFERKDVPPADGVEHLAPPDVPRQPRIVISTGKSWGDIAQAYARLVDAQIDTKDVEPLVRTTLQGQPDKAARAALLLAAVRRQVRYTSLSFGESALAPANCLTTLTRRYGDCKDQSTLLVAMLRAAGHEAYVALVPAGRDEEVPDDLPAVSHFNHAIVYVPGEKPLWIDPSAGFSRVGELPIGCQGRGALICASDTRNLTRTPVAPATVNRTKSRVQITVGDGEPGRGHHVWEYSGIQELDMRDSVAQGNAESGRKWWEKFIVDQFGRASIEKLEFTETNDLSQPFRVALTYAPVDAYMAGGEQWSHALHPGELLERLPLWALLGESADRASSSAEGKRDRRKHDLILPMAYAYELSCQYVPPPGFVVKQIPANEEMPLGPAKISWKTTRDGESATVSLHFETGPTRWSPADVESFQDAIRKLEVERPNGKLPLVVQYEHQAARLLRVKKYREAFDVVQRELSESPQGYAASARMQRMLAQANLVEPALELAQHIVQEHPDRWEAWYQLSQAKQTNAIGQARMPGSDLPECLAAMRKAAELAPTVPGVQFALANLLEFDDLGRRFGDEVRLKEAAAIYETLLDNPVLAQHSLPRLFAIYLVQERYRDMRHAANRVAAEDQRLEWELVSTAALDGIEAVRRKAASVAGDQERIRGLAGAAYGLEFARRYELSAELFDLAADAGRGEDLRNAARVVRSLKRYDPAAIKADDPRSAVQNIIGRAISTVVTSQDLAPLLIGDLSRWEGSRTQFHTRYLGLLRAQLENRGSPAAIQDRLALAQYKVTGSADVGFLIRVTFDATQSAWFVVRGPDGYRVLHMGDTAELGQRALGRLQAGDKAGAQQWLDWAAEPFARAGNIFDAYATPPFAKLWSSGNRDSDQDIRLAASALAATLPNVDAIKLLEETRTKESAGFRKLQIERALISGYLKTRRPQDAETLIDPLLQRQPTNEELLMSKVAACQMQQKAEAIQSLIDAHIERKNMPPLLLEQLATQLGVCGKYSEAVAVFDRIEKRGDMTNAGREARAWVSLFLPQSPPRILADARAAAERDVPRLNHQALHTLATLYAHDEQPEQAVQTLHRAILAQPEKSLTIRDWYVVGRVAEIYGLKDYARRCYGRVTPSKEDNKIDASILALRRLKTLDKP